MVTQISKLTGTPAGNAVESGEARYWLDADSPGLPITLDLRPLLGGKTLAEIDFDQLWEFLETNDLYALEYNDCGELIVMPPLYMPDGIEETELLTDAKFWQREHGGAVASSSTIFRIPGLGGRGPDTSWISPERLAALDSEQYRTGQVCPDFVAEIRSSTNSLTGLRRKMDEYIVAGARLGWLIDPRNRRVTIYRPGQEPEVLEDPEILSGEDVMPGFEFRVRELIFESVQQ